MSHETSENDIRSIERALLKLEDGTVPPIKCNIVLQISDTGSWIIKFRKSGVIVNSRDLIIWMDNNETDAQLSFDTHSQFWTTVNGATSMDEGISKGYIKQAGLVVFCPYTVLSLYKMWYNSLNVVNFLFHYVLVSFLYYTASCTVTCMVLFSIRFAKALIASWIVDL